MAARRTNTVYAAGRGPTGNRLRVYAKESRNLARRHQTFPWIHSIHRPPAPLIGPPAELLISLMSVVPTLRANLTWR